MSEWIGKFLDLESDREDLNTWLTFQSLQCNIATSLLLLASVRIRIQYEFRHPPRRLLVVVVSNRNSIFITPPTNSLPGHRHSSRRRVSKVEGYLLFVCQSSITSHLISNYTLSRRAYLYALRLELGVAVHNQQFAVKTSERRMAADVVSSADLDAELEKARATLRGVEDNIKRVFGKDSTELGLQRTRRSLPLTTRGYRGDTGENFEYEESGTRSFTTGVRGRDRESRLRRPDSFGNYRHEEEPMEKRRRSDTFDVVVHRTTPIVIGPRIKPTYDSEEEDYAQEDMRTRIQDREPRRLQSRIVSSIKEKSREEVLAEQRQDRTGRDRNKRMFGALLGTLQQFKQDETKLKNREDKRAQIEAKLDEAAQQEKESVKKEKQQLIRDRKLKLTEIKRLEMKKRRLDELEEWEKNTKYLANFIRTEASPHIFYLPKILNPIMECRLEASKQVVEEMIVNKRKLVFEDLDMYEERSRRYWDQRLDGGIGDTRRMKIDPLDANMEDELKELMKSEQPMEITKQLDHNTSASHESAVAANGKTNTDFVKSGKRETSEESVPEPEKVEDTHFQTQPQNEEEGENLQVKEKETLESVPGDLIDGQEFQPVYE